MCRAAKVGIGPIVIYTWSQSRTKGEEVQEVAVSKEEIGEKEYEI